MINLASQGSMTNNLARYDGIMDMYVDYVRVYSSAPSGIISPDESNLDVLVSPNPVNSDATIYLNSPNLENISVSIYNTLGQQVFLQEMNQQGDIEIPVDMSAMNNGIYLAKIRVGNQQTSRTIIKK